MPGLLDGIAFVDGEKYVNGETKNVFYVGSKQEDGYIYFNDSDFFRCDYEGHNLQIFYIPKQIWVNTTNLVLKRINGVDVVQLRDDVSNVQNGSGAIAGNKDIEKAVLWAIDRATNWNTEYSQNLSLRDGVTQDGVTYYDCSSFMSNAIRHGGGFNVPSNGTTATMVASFTAVGFKWITGSYWPSFNCLRGDIMVKQFGYDAHTQMYIGNNQDVNCGAVGTGCTICQHTSDNWGRGGWDGILRYGG